MLPSSWTRAYLAWSRAPWRHSSIQSVMVRRRCGGIHSNLIPGSTSPPRADRRSSSNSASAVRESQGPRNNSGNSERSNTPTAATSCCSSADQRCLPQQSCSSSCARPACASACSEAERALASRASTQKYAARAASTELSRRDRVITERMSSASSRGNRTLASGPPSPPRSGSTPASSDPAVGLGGAAESRLCRRRACAKWWRQEDRPEGPSACLLRRRQSKSTVRRCWQEAPPRREGGRAPTAWTSRSSLAGDACAVAARSAPAPPPPAASSACASSAVLAAIAASIASRSGRPVACESATRASSELQAISGSRTVRKSVRSSSDAPGTLGATPRVAAGATPCAGPPGPLPARPLCSRAVWRSAARTGGFSAPAEWREFARLAATVKGRSPSRAGACASPSARPSAKPRSRTCNPDPSARPRVPRALHSTATLAVSLVPRSPAHGAGGKRASAAARSDSTTARGCTAASASVSSAAATSPKGKYAACALSCRPMAAMRASRTSAGTTGPGPPARCSSAA
mmetsp:Transcript_42841/g.128006  ORF Transcript_42841/g.128006 Transcript_42841/m.128006 type:complete len:520 (+) Transcript_42841:177-1736(+)